MKAVLLTTVALITAVGSLSAQVAADFNWELGLNGGYCANTIPGPSTPYRGTKGNWGAAGSFKVDYNINEEWQVGGEIGAASWKTTTNSWPVTDAFGQTLQSQKVTFVVANPAISACVQVNRVMPFYSEYKHFNKANFYYGLSLGLLPTVNDGAITYSKYNKSPDPTLTYVSQYDYGFGMGYTAGVQVGYSYYIVPRFGVNIEVAGRYAYVGTNDVNYAHENSSYHIFYFPTTVGLRYRLD